MSLLSDELSFHEAIRSGDADARLIYADWLEDHARFEEASILHSREWCLIPSGTFYLGGGGGEVGSQMAAINQSFYLGAYSVTQTQWQDVMASNPSYFSRSGDGKDRVKDIPDEELAQFPVENVSWDDTQEFIKKLNEKECGTDFPYRLPTEAEWEYACRGGASSKEECSFHFYFDKPTNDLSSNEANFDGNYPDGKGAKGKYLQRTTRVGSYKPNRLGLFDMHGNVWEWCDNLYESNVSARVLRGGSWFSIGSYCRSAIRVRYEPDYRHRLNGFRVCRSCIVLSD